MPQPPGVMRAITFFDGQNLFRSAKAAFGYRYPNYDPVAPSAAVCASKGCRMVFLGKADWTGPRGEIPRAIACLCLKGYKVAGREYENGTIGR
jgi:hypothetical protein